jgi:hypothetical protein
MESQVLFNIAVSLAGFLGGWVLNNITKAIERFDVDVRQMPHTYIAKDDYRRDIDEIKEIVWVNPDKNDEKPIEWLINGAPGTFSIT